MGHAERRKAVEQLRFEKGGFFGVEDPGPCIALLREIGIDAVDFQDAQHFNEGTGHPEGNVHLGAEIRRRKRGDTIVPDETEVDWRAPLYPAGPAEELSADTGSGSDQGTSDDEKVWWEQTCYGGTILRDGVPPDT
eukprot:3035680-Pyramimonas_sp.AAC.1